MLTRKGVQDFLLSRTGTRPYTQDCYRRHLARFAEAFPGELPDQPQEIQAWLAAIEGEPETVHAYYRTLRAMYNQLRLWHPEQPNPMPLVRAPRLKRTSRRIFSPEELYAIFNQPMPPRDRALFTLLLDTGIRAEEACALTWEGVKRDWLMVNGKGGQDREPPISDTTRQLLLSLLPSDNHGPGWERRRVFMSRKGLLTRNGVYRIVKRWCLAAGLSGRRLSPHTLRHTFATYYAENPSCNPQVLQKIMGHRDFKTTLRYIQGTRRAMVDNHRLCTPLRGLEALAQGRLIHDQEEAVQEAEEIVGGKGD